MKKKLKLETKVIVWVVLIFFVLLIISYRNSVITERFNLKEDKKAELSEIQKQNEQLRVSIEGTLNLNSVAEQAKNLLGMKKLDNSQKIYINFEKKDYIEKTTEEYEVDDDENKDFWQSIKEFFTMKID